jgi:TolB-like protein/DNA-binding winged helix-turn-helix (wHTH) protein/Tfp pilus assembly protein PilF
MSPPALQFGEFELDSAAFELRRKGKPVRIERLPLEFLFLLVSRKGELVGRDEIAKKLWGDDVFVDTNMAINAVARKARVALRDDADNPKYLLTVPSKGYRFVGTVIEEASQPVGLEATAAVPHLPKEGKYGPPEITPRAPPRISWLRSWRIWPVVAVVALSAWTLWRYVVKPPVAPQAHRIMLAVLPFKNLSGDPNQEYIVDGLTEEILTDFGRLSPEQMGVIARTSAMAYKNTDKTIRQIGRELGVDYVLEGSVRIEAGKARVSAQLIQVSDQTHVWAQNFDRDLKNLLEIEDELGQTLAQQVRLNLSPQRQIEFSKMRTANPEAYDLYLKGRFYWNQRTPPAMKQSIEYFQEAIAKDPGFAQAYAGLAEAYNLSYNVGLYSAKESSLQAKAAATRALELDPSIAEAHTALGKVKSHYNFDFPGAEREFLKALELNPNSPDAHFFYANSYLVPMGRMKEAIAENKKALELDPRSLPMNAFLGTVYAWAREYDKAYEQYQLTIKMNQNFPLAHSFLSLVLQGQGRYRESVEEFQKAQVLLGVSPYEASAQAAERLRALEKDGEQGYWQCMLRQALQDAKRNPAAGWPAGRNTSPTGFAAIYAMLGDKKSAFYWLDRAYEEREGQVLSLVKVDRAFDSLRGDPRYKALLQKMGLPE